MRRVALPLAAVLLSGCPREPLAPRIVDGLPAGVDVQLSVEPAEVAPSGGFVVNLTLRNTTRDTIRVVTGHSCLVLLHVLRDGARMPFKDTSWGCRAVVTTHVFPPLSSNTHSWSLSAKLDRDAPAPAGDYTVQVEFETGTRPKIERALRVL